MRHCEKFGVPALAGSCASEARRKPTKVGTPNAKQNPAEFLLTCLKLKINLYSSVNKFFGKIYDDEN